MSVWEGGCRECGKVHGGGKGVYVGGCMWEVGEGDIYVGGWGGREVTSVDHWGSLDGIKQHRISDCMIHF